MTKKQKQALRNRTHFKERLEERYNLKIDTKEYHRLCDKAFNSEVIRGIGDNGNDYRILKYKNKSIFVVYNPKNKRLVTALPKENFK